MRKHIFPAIWTTAIAGLFWLGLVSPRIALHIAFALFLALILALVYGAFYKMWNGP